MAQRAAVAEEQGVGRRVVQVDVVRVGEQELHVAQGVAGPRLLAERQLLDFLRVVPVHRAGVHGLGAAAGAAQDLDVLAAQEVGIARGRRRRLALDDAVRHVPVGAEHHRLHLVAEDRRGVLRLADNHLHLQHRLAVLPRRHVEGRHVHQDVARPQVVGQPAPALEVQRNLPRARVRRALRLLLLVDGGERVLQRGVLGMHGPHLVQPGAQIAAVAHRFRQRGDEVRRRPLRLPQTVHRLRLRPPHRHVSAQRQQRRRQLHVEPRQRLRVVLQLLLDVVLRVDELGKLLLNVVRLDQAMVGRGADDLQRVLRLRR